MAQYDLIRNAVIAVDNIMRNLALLVSLEISGIGIGNDPMTLPQARAFERTLRRIMAPVYGPSRAEAMSSQMFREIVRNEEFASVSTLMDIKADMDRAMNSVDPERWAQVQEAMGRSNDTFARAYMDLGRGPYAREVRRVRGFRVDPNRRWVDPNGYRLSDRVWNIGVQQRRDIDKRIRIGIRRGESPRTIAGHIEKYLNPDYAPLEYRRDGRIVRRIQTRAPHGSSAARRLARTEVQHVAHESTRRFVDTIPVPGVGMRWRLSAAHPKIDICDSLARGGTRGYPPGVYSPGDFPHVPHPQCLCSAEPVMPSREEVLDALWARYVR